MLKGGADAEAFFDSVEKSYEYEERLGVIESEATSAIRQVIEEARKGRCPRLSLENRKRLEKLHLHYSSSNSRISGSLCGIP